MNSHAAFTVRGKKFAYFLNNHHGDGILALCFRGAPGEQQTWIELDAKRYYKPAYIGAQGWVALRLDVGSVNWTEVEARILSSYRLAAPKTLVATMKLFGTMKGQLKVGPTSSSATVERKH